MAAKIKNKDYVECPYCFHDLDAGEMAVEGLINYYTKELNVMCPRCNEVFGVVEVVMRSYNIIKDD